VIVSYFSWLKQLRALEKGKEGLRGGSLEEAYSEKLRAGCTGSEELCAEAGFNIYGLSLRLEQRRGESIFGPSNHPGYRDIRTMLV
jgi:hypothetical protein